MTPQFKPGDRVVCADARDCGLIVGGTYIVNDVEYTKWGVQFVSVGDGANSYAASRFIHDQDTPCPSRADDHPDSPEDYEHNKPHHVIVWGAASLLIWLAFFAGLWCGWAWL